MKSTVCGQFHVPLFTCLAAMGILMMLSLGLSACVPATPTQSPAAPTQAQGYGDPFSYCAALGTIDGPGPTYTGPKMPEDLVKKMMQAFGAAPDAPVEVFTQNSFWRCMNGKVYACTVGANLPCLSKANTDRNPTQAMTDFCTTNPGSDFIPAAVTGHETIYTWKCNADRPEVDKQVFTVDQSGFITEIWYEIKP